MLFRSELAHRVGISREYGGAWLLDATRLQLGDRRARDTHPVGELGLSEVQPLARGPDRERQRRP